MLAASEGRPSLTSKFLIILLMTKLEQIEAAIEKLAPSDVAKLRKWLAEHDARLFDEKIARHAGSGKLDKLADAARANIKAGLGEDF